MKISYALLTHNETDSLEELLEFLVKQKDPEDEIVILDDFSNNEKTKQILDGYVSLYDMKFDQRHLKGDFAGQKNALRLMCEGDWIFNLDSDEIPSKLLMKNIKNILGHNDDIDLFYVPRVNKVEGLTQRHIMTWGWQVDDKQRINWPDWQGRIWRNKSNIYWDRSVHEQLTGFQNYSFFPEEDRFAIIHLKDIKKQEQQNNFYAQIRR